MNATVCRLVIAMFLLSASVCPAGETAAVPYLDLPIALSWGHRTSAKRVFMVQVRPSDCQIVASVLVSTEDGEDQLDGSVCRTQAGGGDIDRLELTVRVPHRDVQPIANLHSTWGDLLAHGDQAAATRLRGDPSYRPDTRRLTVSMHPDATAGFTITIDQLQRHGACWVADLDVLVSLNQSLIDAARHIERLESAGHLQQRPAGWLGDVEASYQQFAQLWEDMGSPSYQNPHAPPPGHIVGVTWDSAIAKFGIDRGGGVSNDLGNPDKFRFWLDIGQLTPSLSASWKGQYLTDGLPVIVTRLEKDGVRYEWEQFAYPLHGPPPRRRGDIPLVLMQRLTLHELEGRERRVPVAMTHHRNLAQDDAGVRVDEHQSTWRWVTGQTQRTLLLAAGSGWALKAHHSEGWEPTVCRAEFEVPLAPHGSAALEVNIPSPLVEAADWDALQSLQYEAARRETIEFWSEYLARGARFEVPEPEVNTLFRANLWHALRLPRRHGESGEDVPIDLPYSNFAYGQTGTPWPVNQAIYVDYMLYDLRGYHDISAEELAAIFRNNQQPDGRVGGYANWGVYTPSMIYAVAQHYLLSDDRASFERLLPAALRAADWCLGELQRAEADATVSHGLVLAPLNDLTHEPRAWAFNQAYFCAGLDLFGQALTRFQHPRSAECRQAAARLRQSIERAFAQASVKSPLVPLRDGTWIPYVPCDALTPGRLMDTWYPTDVDTGSLHLSRLKSLDPRGPLTSYLLRDHEENLFLRGWGMANEPVYNQQATAYLLRDEPEWAIRAFYSMMACAFSHTVFEPVEHRWGWGQYFGPPSTDGAWFELYRNMLIQEWDDECLVLFAATPRAWLAHGQSIQIERAPTHFGPLAAQLTSDVDNGVIRARVTFNGTHDPQSLRIRFRHPLKARMRKVRINGQDSHHFEAESECVFIDHPDQKQYQIEVHY